MGDARRVQRHSFSFRPTLTLAAYLEQQKRIEAGAKVAPAPPKPKKVYDLANPPSREEAMEAYKELLRERGINSTWTQDAAISAVSDDVRSKFLKMADKKAVFQVPSPHSTPPLRSSHADSK